MVQAPATTREFHDIVEFLPEYLPGIDLRALYDVSRAARQFAGEEIKARYKHDTKSWAVIIEKAMPNTACRQMDTATAHR